MHSKKQFLNPLRNVISHVATAALPTLSLLCRIGHNSF